jgi:hypothetical protein
MGIRARIFAIAMSVSGLAILALVVGANHLQ